MLTGRAFQWIIVLGKNVNLLLSLRNAGQVDLGSSRPGPSQPGLTGPGPI